MREAKRAEIRKWLIKSQHDLGSVRWLMEGDEPYLDTAVYHCQQAAERALEAFLTYHHVPFEKSHDLTELLGLAAQADPVLDRWCEVAQELTPNAVRFRYPGDVLEPTRSEAERALQDAQAFVDFIWHLLPEQVKP